MKVVNLLRNQLVNFNRAGWSVSPFSPNKEIKYITAFSKTFRNELDEPLRMIGVNYDVTESTLTQQKLLKQQQDLEEAQHIARVGCWEIDVKDRTIQWSKEMFHICEFEINLQPSLNETYGMFTSQTREYVIQAFFNSIEKHQSFEVEAQLKTRKKMVEDKGGKVWVESEEGKGSKFYFSWPMQEMEEE